MPVSFKIKDASRALTETEERWFQVEKELLAVTFAAVHFHHYIYGREVEVGNDHKSLETIIRMPLQNASLRIRSAHASKATEIQTELTLGSRHQGLHH